MTQLSTSQLTLSQLILTDTETVPSDLILILLSTQQSASKQHPLSIVSENVGRKCVKWEQRQETGKLKPALPVSRFE
jgi:hypothetical protein